MSLLVFNRKKEILPKAKSAPQNTTTEEPEAKKSKPGTSGEGRLLILLMTLNLKWLDYISFKINSMAPGECYISSIDILSVSCEIACR